MQQTSKPYIYDKIAIKLTDNLTDRVFVTNQIWELEEEARFLSHYCTYNYSRFRVSDYATDEARKRLRLNILDRDFSKKCVEDSAYFTNNRKYFQIIGLPGSGKSYIAEQIAKQFNANIIDADLIKEQLPEYRLYRCSASLLHKEAVEMAYSTTDDSLLNRCLYTGNNMVLPRIGYLYKELSDSLKCIYQKGYHIFLILVDIEPEQSLKSCYTRFIKTGRYVPLTKIVEECRNLPLENYNLIKKHNYISGYACLHTDLKRQYTIIEKYSLI